MRLAAFALISAWPIAALLALSPAVSSASDKPECRLLGHYMYRVGGTDYPSEAPVPFDQVGSIIVSPRGELGGESTGSMRLPDFRGHGPVWLLVRYQLSGGVVTPSPDQACSGTANFLVTTTVLKSSNPALIPAETVLIQNFPQSIAYVSTGDGGAAQLLLTSPGTIADGLATRSTPPRR